MPADVFRAYLMVRAIDSDVPYHNLEGYWKAHSRFKGPPARK